MRILITGSAGFVGASFGHYAAAAGHEVLGVSRSSQPGPHWPGLHLSGDVARLDLSSAIREFDPHLVLHAAGSASVAASIADPVGDFHATAAPLVNVLDAIRRSGRDPLVLLPSSAAVYGNPVRLPVPEDAPTAPISPYGFHKSACETLAQEYAHCFGLSIVACRLFSLFGCLQRRLLVSELYEQLVGPSDTVHLQGTGTETRDFLHIDDLSRAFLLLAQRPPRRECTILNVAAGRETPVLELANAMRSLIAPNKDIVCRGIARNGDPHRWCADVRRLQSIIPEWTPKSMDAALGATIRQWRSIPTPQKSP